MVSDWLAFFDRDHAVLADLQERVGQHVADRRIVVAGDRGDLHDLLLVLLVDRRGQLRDGFDDRVGGLGDAARQGHRIGAGGDHLQAFPEDRLGQHGGGRGAVAGHVVGLAGGFLDELGAQVLVRVVQLDVFGDGHAVLGDLGRAPALVEHGVAAARAERAANGAGQLR